MRTTWLLPLILIGFAGTARAQTYRIDPAKSELVVRTFKAGVASGLAHDHLIRAAKLSGELHLDSAKPAESKLSLTVDAASLIADEPEMRKKHHVEKTIGEGDRQKIQTTMLGEDQLDVKKYPGISFASTKIEGGPDRFSVTGQLTLHGKTQPVTVAVETKLDKDVVRARGTFSIKQSDFGIEPYSAALGTIKNKDELKIAFSIVATSAP